jgi:lipid-binding SYLF domain-containing protein
MAAVLIAYVTPAAAQDSAKATEAADAAATAKKLVKDAEATFNTFLADPNLVWFRDNLPNAKGLLIVPSLAKAGFIFGGSGGSGVYLQQDTKTGSWSNPAFYTMGSASWGLQAGVQIAEVILIAMTEKGANAMLSTKFQAGADASIAAGPVGAGAQAATADIVQFSRAKGVFGGLTLEGSVIAVRAELNSAYYGKPVEPVDILIKRSVTNADADSLIAAVSRKISATK